MERSSLGAALALLLVFGAGAAAGVAAERMWLEADGNGPEAEHRDGEKGGEKHAVIERFSEELELTDGQEARIDTILADVRDRMHEMWSEVRPRYRAVVDSARGRIEEVLSEEQARRYRELLRRERERHDDRDRWDGEAEEDSMTRDTSTTGDATGEGR